MTNEDIINKLKDIINELFESHKYDLSNVTMDTRLKEDLQFDSLSTLLVAIGIEKKFSIDVSDMDYQTINQVGNVVEYIQKKMNNGSK